MASQRSKCSTNSFTSAAYVFISLPVMVCVKLGRRTFLRRFRRATGFNLKEYLQYLRVGEAREKLEFSSLPINEISCMVRYEDPGAFRKVFQRTMGLSPGEYRRRFGVADAE